VSLNLFCSPFLPFRSHSRHPPFQSIRRAPRLFHPNPLAFPLSGSFRNREFLTVLISKLAPCSLHVCYDPFGWDHGNPPPTPSTFLAGFVTLLPISPGLPCPIFAPPVDSFSPLVFQVESSAFLDFPFPFGPLCLPLSSRCSPLPSPHQPLPSPGFRVVRFCHFPLRSQSFPLFFFLPLNKSFRACPLQELSAQHTDLTLRLFLCSAELFHPARTPSFLNSPFPPP